MNSVPVYSLLFILMLGQVSCRRKPATSPTPPSSSVGTVGTRTDTLATSQPASVSQPTATTATTGTATSGTATAPPRPRPGIDEARANVAEVDFRYLTAKSKLSFKSKDQDISNASLHLRVRKDSLIWMSISKLGIEAARVLITRDSVTIMDKIEKQYMVYDFPTLSRQFNFDLSFDLLQALIVGNLPLPKRPAQKVKNERDYLLLRQSEGKVMVDNYIGENDRKLKRLMVTEQPTKNALRLDYEDFTALNTFLFPYSSLVTVDYKSQADGQFYQTLIRIKHNKVELVDKDPGFPFSIPSKYQRK
ncbi:DUF4292 domain-containing protein [Fibrella aquatilis]|uniref:DUF4292 domain-containing protein n=1 Tax=Fibrella aquatilis TaxID=2817059 RepID=A0A939G891_9BACT|nr:DUF4292 domain-containing protein [Fibrella aquatilis]MBO0932190.1 DUF4292 domain-containing protein [Fibrella aquatilis]